MNQQRKVVYDQRRKILEGEDMKDQILSMVDNIIEKGMETYADPKLYPEEWDFAGLLKYAEKYFLAPGDLKHIKKKSLTKKFIINHLPNILSRGCC